MFTLIKKNMTNNTIYIAQELIFFHNHLKLNYKSFHLSATPLNVILSH